MNETPQSSKANRAYFEISGDDEDSSDNPSASRDMPQQQRFLQCEFLLTSRALKPNYKLYLPSGLQLPAINMIAIVRSTKLGKYYEIPFHGEWKRFGVTMWREFVKDHKLLRGHQIKLNVVKCNPTSFIIEIST